MEVNKPIVKIVYTFLKTFCVSSSSVQPQLQRWSNASTSTLDYIGGNESENSNTTTTTWQLELTSDEMSWASSLVNIGALFGALCAGFPMEKFGRRVVLMAMVAPYTIGWLLVTLAVYPGIIDMFIMEYR